MITFLIIESDVLLTITQKMFWTYVIENWKFSTNLMNNGLKIDKLIQYCFSHIYAAWLENNTNWSYCNTCENDTTRRYTSSTPCQRTKQLNRYACWKHPDEVIGGSKSHDRGQERRVGMYSTPTEVNIYIHKAVGEMHPSLQI